MPLIMCLSSIACISKDSLITKIPCHDLVGKTNDGMVTYNANINIQGF